MSAQERNTPTGSQNRFSVLLHVLLGLLVSSCGNDALLNDALRASGNSPFSSGDVILVSGGVVATTATPYPLHQITHWNKNGEYIGTLAKTTSAATFLFASDIDSATRSLYFSVENVDRVDRLDMKTMVTTTHILDSQLAGTTMRGLAALSDGGVVVAESTTSVEKFDANRSRVTTNFPIVVTATIQHLKRISGDRFVLIFTGGADNPRVYSNDGVLLSSISGLACGANCDPNDIVELPDGRFVLSYTSAAFNSLEIFDASFTHLGRLYKDTTILPSPGALAVLGNGDILACTMTLNSCERILIDGVTGSRVGEKAFIGDGSLMRQPTSVQVVP